MKLRRYKKRNISSYISKNIMIIVISIIMSFFVINYFSSQINKILLPMAISKTRKTIVFLINNAVNDSQNSTDFLVINKDSKDEIKMVTYDTFKVNSFMNEITYNIQNNIKKIEMDQINYYGEKRLIVAEIPFGIIFGNTMLANIGPKIDVKIDLLGDVLTQIETEVKPYGINNAYVEVRVFLEVNAKVILPFASEDIKITNTVPLSMNIIQGNIPEAYISTYK